MKFSNSELIEIIKECCRPNMALVEFRRLKNTSIKELAKFVGLSPAMVYKIEEGERQGSPTFWANYKEYFNLSSEELNELLKLRQILPRKGK